MLFFLNDPLKSHLFSTESNSLCYSFFGSLSPNYVSGLFNRFLQQNNTARNSNSKIRLTYNSCRLKRSRDLNLYILNRFHGRKNHVGLFQNRSTLFFCNLKKIWVLEDQSPRSYVHCGYRSLIESSSIEPHDVVCVYLSHLPRRHKRFFSEDSISYWKSVDVD